jgi:hypothetical protein
MIIALNVAVVVAPSGMLGRLVGCCPSDLVRQVYSRYFKRSENYCYIKNVFCICVRVFSKEKSLIPTGEQCAFWPFGWLQCNLQASICISFMRCSFMKIILYSVFQFF